MHAEAGTAPAAGSVQIGRYQVNYTHKKTGKTYFKRLCFNASQASGRQVAARVRSGDHQSRGRRIPSAATPTQFLTVRSAAAGHRKAQAAKKGYSSLQST
jgi:hypothetical protein